MGLASRREAERWIKEGRLSVDGKIVKELGIKVDPSSQKVLLDGKPLEGHKPSLVYWMLNKPINTLTSRATRGDQMTIFDLPILKKVPFLISPVGRLDFKTEGLLLLSNDGELVYRLCHPKYEVPRHYQVLVSSKLSHQEERSIRDGIELEDGPVEKIKLKYIKGEKMGASTGSWYLVTVYEGRNRLVRRIFNSLGHRVVRLIRFGFGDLRLPEDLKPGQYRQLTSYEIKELKDSAEL